MSKKRTVYSAEFKSKLVLELLEGNDTQPIKLSPIEFIEKLATLIPPPRIYRHRYFGVLAFNSPYKRASICNGLTSY